MSGAFRRAYSQASLSERGLFRSTHYTIQRPNQFIRGTLPSVNLPICEYFSLHSAQEPSRNTHLPPQYLSAYHSFEKVVLPCTMIHLYLSAEKPTTPAAHTPPRSQPTGCYHNVTSVASSFVFLMTTLTCLFHSEKTSLHEFLPTLDEFPLQLVARTIPRVGHHLRGN